MTTDVSALRLKVDVDAGTGPVIVLLHGINSRGSDWSEVVRGLSGDYRVIAPDLLGFGGSPKPADLEYTADEHAEVLEATLRDLGVDEPFLLVGYSLGGNVAVRYGATHPDRLRRLFLLSAPFYLPPAAYSRKGFGFEYAQAMFFTWLWKLVARQKERDTLLYGLATGKFAKPLAEYLRTDDVSAHWDVMARNLTNTVSKSTFVDDLPKLTMPTVFALGARDPIVRPDQTAALKRIKPDLEIRRISGLTADHLLLDNSPDLVVREILRDEVHGLALRLRQGSGSPVLLLPGIDEHASHWRPVAEALATNHEVAALDLLGFGESPAPLACHYTLADHAAAVLTTVRREFPGRSVELVGNAFGATVALAAAATAPSVISAVTAVSPALVPDDVKAGSDDQELARFRAERATLVAMARDERSRQFASEGMEAEVLPRLRSLDAILATDATDLLAKVPVPVRFVLPTDDQWTPGTWLTELVSHEPRRFAVDRPSGGPGLPYRDPAALLGVLGVTELAGVKPARFAASSARSKEVLGRILGRLNRQLVLRGLLQLLGGLFLLLPIPIPPRLLAFGFAVWLLVEAVQTLGGSVVLRRRGRAWIGWFVIGAVSLVFAIVIAGEAAWDLQLFYWAVVAWAGARGTAAMVVAWRLGAESGRRNALLVEGVLFVLVTVGLVVWPVTGARLLRWGLGAALASSGLVSLGYAYRTHRRTVAAIRSALTPQRGVPAA